MRWGRRWRPRTPRPKAQTLDEAAKEKTLAALRRGVNASPVLSSLGVGVRCLRGRFYIEPPNGSFRGRITPLADTLLLEIETRTGGWSEVARSAAAKLMRTI